MSKKNKLSKPVAGGQISPAERAALVSLSIKRGRSISYLVRLAIVRLLLQDEEIDWSENVSLAPAVTDGKD